jgi:hypothetical protein
MIDLNKLLKYLPAAMGVYGTGQGTPALATGNFAPVSVSGFKADSTSFQAALYKDESTGQYRMAIGGTNDLGDLGGADASLALQNLNKWSAEWNPQMTDALEFANAAIKTIREDLTRRNDGTPPSIDQIRAVVDVTGHSLGGALAELISKVYGLGGLNADGPGVLALTKTSEYIAAQAKAETNNPGLKSNYLFGTDMTFTAIGQSMVGMAGTHLAGTNFQTTPNAAIAWYSSLGLVDAGLATGSFGLLGSAGLGLFAFDVWSNHPTGGILSRAEGLLGAAPVSVHPAEEFGALSASSSLEWFRANPTSPTAYSNALDWYRTVTEAKDQKRGQFS